MMLDDLSTGDFSDWRVTGPDGEDLTDRLAVVPKGSDGGPCFSLDVRLEEGQALRLTKTLRTLLPRKARFRYRCEGEVDVEQLRVYVEIWGGIRKETEPRAARFAVRAFLPETSGTLSPERWIDAQADMDKPQDMRNVWGFYGRREICELSLVVTDASGDFVLLIDRLELVTADEEMGPYVPEVLDLVSGPGVKVVYSGNNAGDLYEVERFLVQAMPDAGVSRHPFRSLSYPPDNWPVSLEDVHLVVLADFDSYVLPKDQLEHLADYVYSGGELLVLAGPNSVAHSLDRRRLFQQMLPVEEIDGSSLRSSSGPIRVSDSSLLGDVLMGHLGIVGSMQRLGAKEGAKVILAAEEGTPLLVEGAFGMGRVVVLNAYPDAGRDRGRSLFWSCCYDRLMGGIAARMAGIEPAETLKHVEKKPVQASIRLPYSKRAFAPGQEVIIEATYAGADGLQLWVVDELGRRVDEVSGEKGAGETWRFTWTVPDLAEGRYRARLSAGDAEEEIAIVCRRMDPMRLPIIARTPLMEGGHWHSVEGLRRMIDDLACHGFNLVAPPVLGTLVSEPYGLTADLSAWLEVFAQERGMDLMYEYSNFGTVRSFQPPTFDPYSEGALERTGKMLIPQTEVADQVPRLWSLKTIDEPHADQRNILPGEIAERVFRERFGLALPGEEEAPRLEGQALLNYYRFLSDYVKKQFEHGYQVAHETDRSWGLLHTFMEPGFGSDAAAGRFEDVLAWTSGRFEDVLAWSNSGDLLDFDIYPYWYVESHKLRFAKVHYGFAFMWAVAAFHDRPMGFYVELDERNHPFQKIPKEATGELAYTAIGEGSHYLNTFIYGTFNTGTMARPERWEDGGEDLRAIAQAGSLIMASKRQPACAAIYFPYDHWILSRTRYYPTFAYELIRRSFGECDLLHQDVARERGIAPYRIVALLGTDVLSEEDEERLLAFVQSGGVLLLDKVPAQTPSGEGLTRLAEAAGRMPGEDLWEPVEQPCGEGKIVKFPPDLDGTYRRAVEEENRSLRHQIEWTMRETLSQVGLSPAASCDDPEFNASLLDADGASILVVVNHRPEEAAALVRVHRAVDAVGYACNLSTGEAIPFWKEDDAVQLTVPLTPRQGILIGLFPEKLSGLSLNARQEGNELTLELRSGGAYPVPVFVEATDPRGRRNVRHSRELVLRGQEVIRSSLAVNELAGEWEFCARCPAAGWQETVRVTLSRP